MCYSELYTALSIIFKHLLDCLIILSRQYFKINQAFLLISTLFNSPASPRARMRAHVIYCTAHDQRPYQSDSHSARERLLLWLRLQFLTGCWSSPSILHNPRPFSVAALLSFLFLHCFTRNPSDIRACIPVGCVPAAHWPYAAVFFSGGGGGSAWSGGGLPGPGGGFLPAQGWGVSAWSGGVLPAWGWSAWSPGGGFLPAQAWVGGCLPGPGGGSPCLGGSALFRGVLPARGGLPGDPPVNRITDTCKNITLATTSLRPVKMKVGAENILVLAPLTSVRCICAVIVVSRPLSWL